MVNKETRIGTYDIYCYRRIVENTFVKYIATFIKEGLD
jgi:hypothetical protein